MWVAALAQACSNCVCEELRFCRGERLLAPIGVSTDQEGYYFNAARALS